MYIPSRFEIKDRDTALEFVEKHAFGQLISNHNGRLFSTHMPFLISDDGKYLLGHIAKKNSQWQDIEGSEILVTFQGPHDYISPTWYEGSGVPTWNYQSVHIYGRCKIVHEISSLQELVNSLTKKYESKLPQPWLPVYDKNMLKAILGFKIEITDLECKFKLSQNRSVNEQANIATQLQKNGSQKLAEAMLSHEL